MPLTLRKFFSCFLLILLLAACDNDGFSKVDSQDLYMDMIELLQEREQFATSSSVCQIQSEVAKIEDGYRYYITIDNPSTAMYDVEAIAIEKDVDYSKMMAANIGIFDEKEYSLIPNQVNVDDGYIKGFTISGTSVNKNIDLYLLLQWKNLDGGVTSSEFIVLNLAYGA